MNYAGALERLGERLLSLGRTQKRLIAFVTDAATSVLAMLAAFYLRLGYFPPVSGGFIFALVSAPALALPIFYRAGLYRAVFRHVGARAMLLVAYAVALVAAASILVFTIISVDDVPRTIGIIQPVVLLIFVLLTRLIAREWFSRTEGRAHEIKRRAAIYGAGQTGRQFANALSATHDFIVVAYIDDDPLVQNTTLNGVEVRSFEQTIIDIERGVITDVLLAIPSADRARRNAIINRLRPLKVRVLTVPSVSDMARGALTKEIKELDIDDLLSRPPVEPNEDLFAKTVTGKTVLVTGAGGSIGSELCRQIIRHHPAKLVMVDQSEYSLYEIGAEIEASCPAGCQLVPVLASVRDRRHLDELFGIWRPRTVYHAAAYKHVPLVEDNILEGIANNAFGTLTVAQTSAAHGVESFVLISTDKAVRPTNIMGATKRLAEMILQVLSMGGGKTCYSMVRFGNVLNSSGSVVPRFRRQIDEGGPITITHPDITRFFMTIPEAAQLVIQAAGLAEGGEVFVLDMGEPVRIFDLARSMIMLSGLQIRDENNPDGDIEINIVGLRPGEKLFEELLLGNNPMTTLHERIFKANEPLPFTDAQFWSLLRTLEVAVKSRDLVTARAVLLRLVPDYRAPDHAPSMPSAVQAPAAAVN
jgi:FlaA1/EpsC-like NDP-sugar epimerase